VTTVEHRTKLTEQKSALVSPDLLREFHKLFSFVSYLHEEEGLCLLNISPEKILVSALDKVSQLPKNLKLHDLTRASSNQEMVPRSKLQFLLSLEDTDQYLVPPELQLLPSRSRLMSDKTSQ
jgi:hypothetical protein